MTKGNLITSAKKTTHEISIKINDPGEYVIKIKSEDNEVSKDYRIKINDKFAVYGVAIDMLDLNIIEEDEMKMNFKVVYLLK